MDKDFKKIKLAISCGGTGGHFYPGLSVARKLNQLGGEAILLLSGVNSANQQKISESVQVKSYALPNMCHPLKNPIKFLKGFFGGFIQARKILKENEIDAILGMGSFASLPPIFAAKTLKLPLFLHDGNARIGKANRYLSFLAKKLWSAFDMVNSKSLHCPRECIGMPLRPEITDIERISKSEAITSLNQMFKTELHTELPTLLIFGGSQGAEIFNVTLPKALQELAKVYKFQVLHLTGKNKLEYTQKLYNEVNFPYLLVESSENMELFYQSADLIFSRSGGSTVAEIAFFGKPSVLVPYPYAAENHQFDNAQYLASNDAAIILDNKNCQAEKIIAALDRLLANPKELSAMADKCKKKAKLNVAENILSEIYDSIMQ